MCKDGVSQSPINITDKVSVDANNLEKILFNYHTDGYEVVNNGHTIQVNVKSGSSIKVDGIRFNLIQFHFHTPSENQINGKNFPLEVHFVHASDDGKLAVVSVMFEEGKLNYALKKIWYKMPHRVGHSEDLELSKTYINLLIPKDKAYYRFSGSLTTPPCSEGVRWFVLKEYNTISTQQLNKFAQIVGENNRPIQGINARKVMK